MRLPPDVRGYTAKDDYDGLFSNGAVALHMHNSSSSEYWRALLGHKYDVRVVQFGNADLEWREESYMVRTAALTPQKKLLSALNGTMTW